MSSETRACIDALSSPYMLVGRLMKRQHCVCACSGGLS